MVKRDNIHYSYRAINGYNKAFNFVLSARELGKTATFWLEQIYFPWKKDKRPWLYLTRMAVEINEALIDSIADTILNKFTDDEVKLTYTKGAFKDGIVDVFINKELFFRIVSLNIQLRRIKLAVLKNAKGSFMDEYIIDPKTGEKYIKQEAFKIKEAYTTWRRECDGVFKMYFVANPYSLYNPLFIDWGVDVNKLKKDSFYVGDSFVIHWAILSPELRAYLLQVNPLYKFDEDYTSYALEGTATNDAHIKIAELPQNYKLKFVFHHNGHYIGIYQNNYIEDHEDRYYCQEVDVISARRSVYCFEFSELVERCVLMSSEERDRLNKFKIAMRRRLVAFNNINCYYFIEEIYNNL